jgi:dipeptidyl aminopeptidase/acylaminoacyl peptidase
MRIMFPLAAAWIVATFCYPAHAQPPQQPFTVQDLMRLKRVSDPRVSPDGRRVAFVLRETDMAANRGVTDIWLLELGAREAEPRRLTRHAANDSSPRWAPDSRTLYFLSSRSDSSQVWRLTLDGGEAIQVTDYPLEVSSLKVSPAGNRIAIAMQVFADCADLKCTKARLDAADSGAAKGRMHDRQFVRHWDTWQNGTRSHLFSAALAANGKAGAPVDLSAGLEADVPSKPFGGDEDFDFSPDGRRVVFSAREAGRTEAWSTNFDLFEVASDGTGAATNLTAANRAWDAQPVFLPNGDLAYLAMERPGFEADRFQIMLRDARGQVRSLTRNWDRSVSRLGVMPGGLLLATTDEIGEHPLYSIDPARDTPRKLVATGYVADYSATKDGVVFAWASLGAPGDLHLVAAKAGEPRRLTSVNRELLQQRSLGEFEQFSFKGASGETVYGYIVKPHGFEAGKRHPLAFFVHGGPQVSFQNQWSYRWNAQTFAGAGYAFVTIDFHGSPGYGQAFTDSVSRDWGGKAVEDLQKGLAAVLAQYSWIDDKRICALGASYGGFMMNWLAGNWSEPFRCFVNHAGIFDQRSFYYSTEELWFPEWDFGGPYFENPQSYERWNPANFVSKWRVPMLVSHGQLDFRVPYSQSLATFTALQRRGIESQLLVFPDENHWVLKPANAVQWYGVMLDWLNRYLR